MNCVLAHSIQPIPSTPFLPPLQYWSQQRNERFAQGGPRGMGPNNAGFGRVREEFDGPAKKARF